MIDNRADYGFKYNATRDGYLVDEEVISVVKRVFHMIGVEGTSIRGVVATLNRECVKPPGAPWTTSGRWGTQAIRENIQGRCLQTSHLQRGEGVSRARGSRPSGPVEALWHLVAQPTGTKLT
jgi:hypothetical protein